VLLYNKSAMDPLVQVITSKVLGEGPHYDDSNEQQLLYVDIFGSPSPCVHRVDLTGKQTKVNIPGLGGVSFVIPVEGMPGQFVISTQRTLVLMEWDGHSPNPTRLTNLLTVEPGTPGNRFNDAKCDALGRLWAGTIVEGGSPAGSGNLYKISEGVITTMVTGINTSNGICWNKENTLMYYIDTPTRKVDVFDYNHVAGTISNRRTVYDYQQTGEAGSPDGMTIDEDDNLWIGCWGGHQIIHINPRTGQKIKSIPFPTANITSAAFAGPNLDILYVTSATAGLSEIDLRQQPAAGALFKMTNLGVKGQGPGNPYKPTNFRIPK